MKFLRKKPPQPQTVLYRLERLSEYWRTKVPRVEGSNIEERAKALSEVEWDNEDVSLFWDCYVVQMQGCGSVAKRTGTIQSILMTLDQAADFPSVIPEDADTPAEWRAITGVPLRVHSIRVTQHAIDFLQKSHPEFPRIAGWAMIACLSHDIGLIYKANPTAGHAWNSANWLKSTLSGIRNTEQAIEAVKFHHAPDKRRPKENSILSALIQANQEVRKAEKAQGSFTMTMATKNATDHNLPTQPKTDSEAVNDQPAEAKAPGSRPNESLPDAFLDSNENEPLPESVTAEEDQIQGETNPDPLSRSHKSANGEDKLKMDTAVAATSRPRWMTAEQITSALALKIDQMDFEAFCFEGNAYFKPRVVREVIESLARKNNDEAFLLAIKSMEQLWISELGGENKQIRLRFGGKIPPLKNYYIVLPINRLGIQKADPEIPRDREGRFLKKIAEMN